MSEVIQAERPRSG